MINLQLTVREALWILSKCETYDSTYDKIVSAFEDSVGVKHRCSVTITGGMSTNNRISCIKVVRAATGLGLKDAKDWTDQAVGRYNDSGFWVNGGNHISITLSTPEKAEQLLRDLTGLGCEGFLS